MRSQQRMLLRVAAAIEQRLPHSGARPINLPHERWSHLHALTARARFCRDRGMFRAENVVRRNLRWEARRLSEELSARLAEPSEETARRSRSTLRDIYGEIRSLEHEFGDVVVDLKERTLSVSTQPIVLADVNLGPFRIELDYRQIGKTDCYRVIALKPNRPPGHSRVTHPHVQHDSLCEGDGKDAIKAALRDGRIYDFFLLVSQVLRHYNRGNAYAELSTWIGVECQDCREAIEWDAAYHCGLCGADVCRSCVWICLSCRDEMCSECTSACARCHRTHCAECLTKCSVCQVSVCHQCGDGGQCRSCRPASQESTNEDGVLCRETADKPADRPTNAITAASGADASV